MVSNKSIKHPTAAERQKALDEISEADRQKIESKAASGIKVDQEWLLLAEFAMLFGWDAYLAAKHDQIPAIEMFTLIAAARKIQAGQQYDRAVENFIGAISAASKNPGSQFSKLTKQMLKKAQADE